MITLKEYIDENAASDSLKAAQKQKPTTTAEVETLAAFMKLAPEHKARTLEWLNNSLADAIPDGTAKKNRKSRSKYVEKNKQSMKSGYKPSLTNEELDELLSQAFPDFTPGLRQQFAGVFLKAVSETSLRESVLQVISENPDSGFELLFNEEQLDMCRLLVDRIESLEQFISEIESENLELARNIVENQGLFEEALYSSHQKSAEAKRALDMDSYVDPENSVLVESDQEHVGDWKMRKRLEYLEQNARPEVTPASNLIDTWAMFDK
jgi:hypothetical protein